MKSSLKIGLAVLIVFALLAALSWQLSLPHADAFTAFATLLLAIAAFFTIIRDEVRRLIRHPAFDVEFLPQKPDCNATRTTVGLQSDSGVVTHQIDSHYMRARIKNTGEAGAEDVEVSVLEVRLRGADNVFRKVPMATPWNLVWANLSTHVLHRLPVGAERHIDLGHVLDPAGRQLVGENLPGVDANQTVFCLAFFVKSNTGEYLLRPGVYEIDFQIYAANSHPSRIFTFHLNHTGTWFADEERMYTQGAGMSVTP